MNKTVTRNTLGWLGIMLIGSIVIAYLGINAVPEAIFLYYLDLPANPYFVSEQAWLLYGVLPAVVLGSLVLWFIPGIFLVLAYGKATRWTTTLSQGFGLSLIVYFLTISIVKLLTPSQPSPFAFFSGVCLSGILSWCLLAFRVFKGAQVPWPLANRREVRRLLWTLAIPIIILLFMLPVFLWQDMHDDGVEALEIGRSLSRYLLIRFPVPGGTLGLGNGMIPVAFPTHWFTILYGPVEAAARFPILLFLPVVFSLIVDMVEWRSRRDLGVVEEMLLLLALGIYLVAMGYNASYDVYFADLASPTVVESMTILCMLAAIYFLWSDRVAWFYLFAILSYLSRPTGLMILVMLAASSILVMREERKRWLLLITSAIGLCLLIAVVYDQIYTPLIAGMEIVGYKSFYPLGRMRFIRLIDFSRLNFGLIPSGILPFLSLFFFPWQDRYARMITLVTIAYYGIFFFQGFVALHHFVPVMIFPLIVFWRIYLQNEIPYRRVFLALTAAAGVIAILLSLPRSFDINRTVRYIGQKIQIKIGDYDYNHLAQLEHDTLFFELIPPDWEVEDASTELISGYNSLIYYGSRPKLGGDEINYIVQYIESAAPEGFTFIAADDTAALYIRNLEEWDRDRFQELRTDAKSPLFNIPRSTKFYYFLNRELPEGQLVIDLLQFVDFGLSLSPET